MKLELEAVKVQKPKDMNVIIGHSHFIKTVEDIYEELASSVPSVRFGLAFCEASAKRLVRVEGNDEKLKKIAADNALNIACGHMFFIALEGAYPVNVLNRIKNVSEVCRIFCATANPLEVITVKTGQGKGIVGVVDGLSPLGAEGPSDVKERRQLLRKFGYKL